MPPLGRYGPQGGNLNFQNMQQPVHQHAQQPQPPPHPQQQQHHHPNVHLHHPVQHTAMQLPTGALGGHPGFMSGMSLPGSNMHNGGFDGARLVDGGGTGLASHSAQLSFARGGQMPPQQQSRMNEAQMGSDGKTAQAKTRIRNVWKSNLAAEMHTLRQLVDKYPFIAMDTEFPGIVARPIGQFTTKADYHYQTLRCNVDLLKMIQLGITLFAIDGSLPPPTDPTNPQTNYLANFVPSPYSWQFNFAFSLSSDMYAQDSTTMLEKAGIDFAAHEKNGIDAKEFGALLYSSGLVLEPDVNWISFHSGYDFGYLMKIMLQKLLPDDEDEFHKLLTIFFPSLYDIKFLLKHAARNGSVNNNQQLSAEAGQILQKLQTKSGLQDIADELGISRIGIAHQAGSDSLLTGQVYFKMKEKMFGGQIDDEKYRGLVWGLNGLGGQMSGPSQRDFATPNMTGATFYNANGTPSTPQNGHIGLTQHQNQNQTPVPPPSNQNPGGVGHVTPGGGGGGFGMYQYAKA